MGYDAEMDVLEKDVTLLLLPAYEPQVVQPVAWHL
jgi:hypothetical protein